MSYRSWREQSLIRQLLQDYKRSVRPRGTNMSQISDGGPVVVLTTLKLKSISSFNDANMEFTAEFRFIQEWIDTRLAFDKMLTERNDQLIDWVYMADDQLLQLWVPDTFFQNEKRGHDHKIDRMNQFLKVSKGGSIVYNKRFSMTFSCVMELVRYPHDVQTCYIDFSTYAYTTNDIKYVWSETPIVMEAGSKLRPKFSIESIRNESCTSSTNTGEYSCLRIELELRRVFSFFLLQLYIPSIMLVGVSCVSYWIDWKASPARVPLSIVTLLTMITQSHAINSSLPPVSYTKAIDVWIGACIVFIFGSLIEYAVVNYTGVQEERRKQLVQRRNFFLADTPVSTDKPQSQPTFLQTIISGATVKQKASPQSRLRAKFNRRDRMTVGSSLVGCRLADLDPSNGGLEVTVHPRMFPTDLDSVNYSRQRRLRQQILISLCPTWRRRGRAERIDMMSRVIFPVSFICFNLVYWSVYW